MSHTDTSTRPTYIHGTSADEQARLSRLNEWLNARCLREVGLRAGERVLDVGCGLGQFSRLMGRELRRMDRIAPMDIRGVPQGSALGGAPRPAPGARVVAVERDPETLDAARKLAADVGETALVDFRQGDVLHLPLEAHERGFEVVHCRFVLEHMPQAAAAVAAMVAAAAPGGRVVLIDEDHDVFRLNPALPEFEPVWRAYIAAYARNGCDPSVGRHLTTLLHGAGARPARATSIFFGACAGSADFELHAGNLAALMTGARASIEAPGGLDARAFDAGLAALAAWRKLPDAAIWYAVTFAEGVKAA
jgi:ubiquinone/menaquinone biosynthesis C-methylase UbiE